LLSIAGSHLHKKILFFAKSISGVKAAMDKLRHNRRRLVRGLGEAEEVRQNAQGPAASES